MVMQKRCVWNKSTSIGSNLFVYPTETLSTKKRQLIGIASNAQINLLLTARLNHTAFRKIDKRKMWTYTTDKKVLSH